MSDRAGCLSATPTILNLYRRLPPDYSARFTNKLRIGFEHPFGVRFVCWSFASRETIIFFRSRFAHR
jgi:hypothetical protein